MMPPALYALKEVLLTAIWSVRLLTQKGVRSESHVESVFCYIKDENTRIVFFMIYLINF